MNFVSSLIIPLIVLIVIINGLFKKVNVYDTFVEGAKESFDMVLKLFPALLAMILAVNILINSDIINILLGTIKSISFFPIEIIPMAIVRSISGTASLAILTNIYEVFGPDSSIGMLGSFIQGSADTTFYILTLYFGSIGIKKIKYALWAGLFADLIGIIISIIMVNLLF